VTVEHNTYGHEIGGSLPCKATSRQQVGVFIRGFKRRDNHAQKFMNGGAIEWDVMHRATGMAEHEFHFLQHRRRAPGWGPQRHVRPPLLAILDQL
jgi:hypothetical protein